MKILLLAKLGELFAGPNAGPEVSAEARRDAVRTDEVRRDKGAPAARDRSSYERFAIPYSFKPQLSLAEAAVAAFGAFIRIVLGSILFAVWGAYILLTWTTVHNLVLRCAAVLALVASLGAAMALLMLGVTALTRRFWPAGRTPR